MTDTYRIVRNNKMFKVSDPGKDFQESVLDELNFTSAEPAAPADGDRYINTATGTSDVTSQAVTATRIYQWDTASNAWLEYTLDEGAMVRVEDINSIKIYDGAAWGSFADGALPVVDETAIAYKTGDSTANMRIDANAITTATTRVLTMPDQNIDLTPGTGSFATAAQGTLADSAQQPPTEGAFANGDKTKLDGIEALADVTDPTNVSAAGAVMESDVAGSVDISYAQGAPNTSIISFQLKDRSGINIEEVFAMEVYLSDSEFGVAETASAPDGSVTGTSGTDILTITSEKRLRVLTNEEGLYKLTIVDSSKTAYYPAVFFGLKHAVGLQLTAGDYGA